MTSDRDWNTATLAEMKRELARCYTLDGREVPAPCPDCGVSVDELCEAHAPEAERERARLEDERAAQALARDRARARELYEAAGRPVPEWAR